MVAMLATAYLEPAGADDGSRQYQFAKGLYAREQWESAAAEFESFLRDHSDHAEAAKAEFYLAEALVQNRRFADAAKRFQHYLNNALEEGFRKQALFRVAECSFLGNMPTAQPALEGLLYCLSGRPTERNRLVVPWPVGITAREGRRGRGLVSPGD